jgi:hypothetical protein
MMCTLLISLELIGIFIQIGAVAGQGEVFVRHPDIPDQALDPVTDGRINRYLISTEINDAAFLGVNSQAGRQQTCCQDA